MVERNLTGREKILHDDELIVTKTDLKGLITYANSTFERISGYENKELIGKPQNIVRHPAMPRCVFKLLWDTIAAGNEIFAYVVNRSKNGDHYWVLAHVTPDFHASGQIVGYHSCRRSVTRAALSAIEPLYADLLAQEDRHKSRKDGMHAAAELMSTTLAKLGVTYEQYVLGL